MPVTGVQSSGAFRNTGVNTLVSTLNGHPSFIIVWRLYAFSLL